MKVKQFLKKYDVQSYREVVMTFQAPGVFVQCADRDEFHRLRTLALKNDIFIGENRYVLSITLMDKDIREKQLEEEKKYREYEDAWWEKYRNADEETKRLMACGAICAYDGGASSVSA